MKKYIVTINFSRGGEPSEYVCLIVIEESKKKAISTAWGIFKEAYDGFEECDEMGSFCFEIPEICN